MSSNLRFLQLLQLTAFEGYDKRHMKLQNVCLKYSSLCTFTRNFVQLYYVKKKFKMISEKIEINLQNLNFQNKFTPTHIFDSLKMVRFLYNHLF